MQQLFVQSILSRGALKEENARDLYHQSVEAFEENSAEEPFKDFVCRVNSSLNPLGMELSGARMEDSNEYWYAIVNRLPDVAARMGSKFTAQELEFFNKVVKLLVEKEGVVSSTELLNLTCQMERRITASSAQGFLKTLVKEHWLRESSGELSPGPRFILELRPFLREIYGENISLCKMCNEPVITGQSCQSCDVRLHLLCVAKLARGRSEISCPGCHEKWSHDIPDIDLPVTSDPSVNTSTIQSGHGYNEAPPSKRPRRR